MFTRTGSTWTQQAKLVASDGAGGDNVRLLGGRERRHRGGRRALGDVADIQGSAYVFTRTGSTWTEQAKLTAVGRHRARTSSAGSVALSGDTAVVGAPGEMDRRHRQTGLRLRLHPLGIHLDPAGEADRPGRRRTDDHFGDSVAVDGDTAVVGAEGSLGFCLEPRRLRLHADGVDLDPAGEADRGRRRLRHSFGRSVALSGDTAVVGAPLGRRLGASPPIRAPSTCSRARARHGPSRQS